jgi:hypothetical protein
MSFFQKLYSGWWWFGECFNEWTWCITDPDNTGGDFFCHLCSDYVAYEEETYHD